MTTMKTVKISNIFEILLLITLMGEFTPYYNIMTSLNNLRTTNLLLKNSICMTKKYNLILGYAYRSIIFCVN